MTQRTAIFLVQPGALPPDLAGCAVVKAANAVFRVIIGAASCAPYPVEVAELGELLPNVADPWHVRARGQWTPRELRGRVVADKWQGIRDTGLGHLELSEVVGEPLGETHEAAIGAAADAAMQVRMDMSEGT